MELPVTLSLLGRASPTSCTGKKPSPSFRPTSRSGVRAPIHVSATARPQPSRKLQPRNRAPRPVPHCRQNSACPPRLSRRYVAVRAATYPYRQSDHTGALIDPFPASRARAGPCPASGRYVERSARLLQRGGGREVAVDSTGGAEYRAVDGSRQWRWGCAGGALGVAGGGSAGNWWPV